jgi:prepilin-type N-terminal cleavage/methylation domain-containing protein/prepilin-type processing-associated H-X9-DG protein
MERNRTTKRTRALSLTELLVVVAIIGVLSFILFPVLGLARETAKKSNRMNLRKIALAAIRYGDDAEERIPILMNSAFRNLRNVRDGSVTAYGEQRCDMWPLLLLPYLKDRELYVDPERGDPNGIFSGPALATNDPGYVATGNNFRNQNRFAFFGMNFVFLAPGVIPASKMSDATPIDFTVGEPRRFFQAEEPEDTVFFAPSTHGNIPVTATDEVGEPDPTRGFSTIMPPGLWAILAASSVPYLSFWTGTRCSGDWCGADIDPRKPGNQTSEGMFFQDPARLGNNIAFLDGHVRFMKTVDLAAGTNYLTATPTDGGTGAFGGGASITDKTKYIWNLDDNYYGA